MRKRTDIFLGFLFLGISAMVYFLMRDIPFGTIEDGMGPALFPTVLLAVLIFLSLSLVVGGIIRGMKGSEKPEDATEEITELSLFGPHLKIPGIITVLVTIYLLFLEALGYLVVTPALLFVTMMILGSTVARAVVVGISLTGLTYITFGLGLRVPLPLGYIFGY